MKIGLKLSELQKLIIVSLYFSTCKGDYINPITEKQLKDKLKRKASLFNSLEGLVKKGYVMRTYNKNKYHYALSSDGRNVYDLLGLLSELGIATTKRDMTKWLIMNGMNPDYYFKDLRESKVYETLCCECFSLAIVKEDKILSKDNLCPKCQIEQGKINYDL